MSNLKLKKGDTVQILAGKDRNKRAKIMRVVTQNETVVVEGLNMVSKHQKPKSAQKPGEILKKEMPLKTSKVALVCSSCQKAIRVGFKFDDKGNKYRVCPKCQEQLN